jgi:aminopeptidase N
MEAILALALALLFGTSPTQNQVYSDNTPKEKEIYNPSATRLSDVIHTDLAVSFNWEKQHLLGQAELTISPYFYSSNELILDAKGFDIHSINMNGKELSFEYDSLQLFIQLDREYQRNEKYIINIDYTAKPNDLKIEGSDAITDAKGLYFINPLGKEDKPQQIWTQGETEASSCWFPTIDKPNERMTQNIAITAKDEFVTLSNGLLVKSEKNGDGTRTDYWEQKLAHTPYLAMLGVGDFNITSDKWKDIDVDYYLEDDYHPFARAIFGRTPQMIAHFSEILGVEYPWEKYAQIIVRDFVSGAMENTTAVIYGEFVQMTDRELVDDHEEDIIAHELFHHWFGDLVTCESWANLPLNESFATYGEYIWREKGFGRMEADMHLDADLNNYLRESQRKQVDMIRFNYLDKEDMFDNHSYAKGGRVLHMLRYYLGDEAFYKGLKKYLNDNAFSTVEIHQLRIAMEEVCGEDLNWFFNQWFLASGHPLLVIDYEYDADNKQQIVKLEQIQEKSTTPIHRLPFYIDIYENGVPKRYLVEMNSPQQDYYFDVEEKPTNVIVDAEHVLLAEIFDEKPDEWWLEQLKAPLYMDSKIALDNISEKSTIAAIQEALTHDFWGIRLLALQKANALENIEEISEVIKQQATQENNPTKVRSSALILLAQQENNSELTPIFESAIEEKSLLMAASGLYGLSQVDYQQALSIAPNLEKELPYDVAKLYVEHGEVDKNTFFTDKLNTSNTLDLYYISAYYVLYLKNQELSLVLDGTEVLEEALKDSKSWMAEVSKYRFADLEETIQMMLKNEKNKELKLRAKETLARIESLL